MGAKRKLCAQGPADGAGGAFAMDAAWRQMKVEDIAAAHQFGRYWNSTGHVAFGEATRVMRGPVLILMGASTRRVKTPCHRGDLRRSFLAGVIMWPLLTAVFWSLSQKPRSGAGSDGFENP